MRMLFMRLVLILLIWTGVSSALKVEPIPKDATITDYFNTNCLQMTQSQQMLKAYIMKGLQSSFEDPDGKLKDAIPVYDKRFEDIKNYFQARVKDKKAKEAFDKAEQIWKDSKRILESEPTKDEALKLRENFSKMIPLLLEGSKPAAKSGLELLSLTGKLCRDPMKISIDYLLRIWGVDLPDYEADVTSIIDEYHKHLDELRKHPLNDVKSLALLKKAERGFKFFEVMYKSHTAFVPNLISKKADDNFKIIRAIKAEYRKQIRNH